MIKYLRANDGMLSIIGKMICLANINDILLSTLPGSQNIFFNLFFNIFAVSSGSINESTIVIHTYNRLSYPIFDNV